MNKVILHIIFLMVSVSFSYAQELYDHQLDENKWGNIKEGIRYDNEEGGGSSDWTFKDKKSYQKWKKGKKGGGSANGNKADGGNGTANGAKPKPISKPKPRFNPDFGSLKGLSFIGWIILVVLGAGIIYLIIKYILDSNSGNKKVKPVDYIEEEVAPSEIPLTELQRLLKEALEKEDFRAAVRIYYLFILKDLSSRHWIKWEKEKTNMHYLYEMQKQKVYDDFSQTVNYFEIVWYGKRDINKQQFNTIQPSFTNLLNKLGIE